MWSKNKTELFALMDGREDGYPRYGLSTEQMADAGLLGLSIEELHDLRRQSYERHSSALLLQRFIQLFLGGSITASQLAIVVSDLTEIFSGPGETQDMVRQQIVAVAPQHRERVLDFFVQEARMQRDHIRPQEPSFLEGGARRRRS